MIRSVLSRTSLLQLAALSVSGLVAGMFAALMPPPLPDAGSLESGVASQNWLEPGTKDLQVAIALLQESGFMRLAPRPEAGEIDAEDTATTELPEIMAIVLSNGETVVYAKLSGELITASAGEMIGDWRVEEIRSDSILLQQGDRRVSAAPFSSSPPPSPPLP